MQVTVSDLTPEILLERVGAVHEGVAESDKATRERLKSIEPTHGRVPLSPEQVDSFRPKKKDDAKPVDEARAIAYQCGIMDLEPVIRRLILLEAKVAEQQTEINALRNKIPAA
jgi:hypothetical protein